MLRQAELPREGSDQSCHLQAAETSQAAGRKHSPTCWGAHFHELSPCWGGFLVMEVFWVNSALTHSHSCKELQWNSLVHQVDLGGVLTLVYRLLPTWGEQTFFTSSQKWGHTTHAQLYTDEFPKSYGYLSKIPTALVFFIMFLWNLIHTIFCIGISILSQITNSLSMFRKDVHQETRKMVSLI